MPAIVTRTIDETRRTLLGYRDGRRTIGFVPTMGALHAGHGSLIRAARAECDAVVVSIFVNPTQFAPNEDLARYPRTFDADRALCEAIGTDVIFAPEADQMYPPGSRTYVDLHGLTEGLCGPKRPGHFRGVATVVLKLFQIVQPTHAYFGAKDAQQCRVIARMTADLDVPVTLRIMPTIREPDGLAMSSRNRYLGPVERERALVLIRALRLAEEMVDQGERSVPRLIAAMTTLITAIPGTRIDYVEIVDDRDLSPMTLLDRPALAALAVYVGTTRLIDNVTLRPPTGARPAV